ncbi:MAG TPA: alkaline phosphatase family protein [bacterium]|nr:alkaline phosphatase family protein [bacterium]
MRRRVAVEIILGLIIIAGFFYWLYLRPPPEAAVLSPGDPAIERSIKENRNQVLIIGLDGMTWDVALPLINEGRMPTFARLLARSTHGMSRAAKPLISPAIWTSMATGQPPSAHGIDNFLAKLPFQYREVTMTSRFRLSPALWQMASWAGRSVGVVNWYAASPAEKVKNGVFVAENAQPENVDEKNVYPPEWVEKLRSVPLPQYAPYEELIQTARDSRVQRAYELDRGVFVMALEILREEHPDLMMVYFQNIDVLSHGFWKYRWPMGLDHYFTVSKEERDRYRDVVETQYEFTDRMVGGLLGEADDYTVIILSDHGLGPAFQPHNIFPDLNQLLERMGYLGYDGPTCDGMLSELVKRGELGIPAGANPAFPAYNIFVVCRELANETLKWRAEGADMMEPAAVEGYLAVRLKLTPARDEAQEKARREAMLMLARALRPDQQRQDMLWSGTRAWNGSDFHKQVQGLYINLAEREPEGIVPEPDYKSFRRELVRALASLRTEENLRLFTMVKANPDKQMMPMGLADRPDVLVQVNRDALLNRFAFRGPADQDPVPLDAIRWSYQDVSADHVPDGVFLVSGQNAKTFKELDAGGLDITPTVLWLMGLPVGADMPGRVLAEAFEAPLQERAPLYIPSWSRVLKGGGPEAPPEIPPEKMRQLHDIGYIQ